MITNNQTLACWLKADAGTFADAAMTVAASGGGPVQGWADQSGCGAHATQPVASQAPTLQAACANGLPALQFAAASKSFLSLGAALGKPREWSVFVVMAVNDPSIRQAPHGSVNAAGDSSLSWGNGVISQLNCPSGSSAPDFGDGGTDFTQSVTAAGVWSPGAFQLMSFVHRDNDASVAVFKNGAQLPTTQPYSSAYQCSGPSSSYSIGREGDYDGLYLDGRVAEVLIYRAALLAPDRSSVESYLTSKWGT